MARRKKINLPLIEVIIGSLILHVVALLVLGSYTVYQIVRDEETEFEAAPPPAPVEQPEVREKQVSMERKQKTSRRPVPKIVVKNPTQMNLPDINIDLPVVDARVAVAPGAGAGGIGRDFGSDKIDFSRSAVNFFGIKSQGEKILFLVDASNYMLEDRKGGTPAYNLVKAELKRMVQDLSPGTLFNVMFYTGRNVYAYSPRMLPATKKNKTSLEPWVDPINSNINKLGVRNNMNVVNKDIDPMKDKAAHWVKGTQVALEQGVDTVFMIVAGWQHHGRGLSTAEREAFHKKRGWTAEDAEIWRREHERAREWLKKENEKRRKEGVPERVVASLGPIINELNKGKRLKRPPSSHFEVAEVQDFVRKVSKTLYQDKKLKKPSLNVIYFVGKDEGENRNVLRTADHFKKVATQNRGKVRVLNGLEALKNVTSAPVETPPEGAPKS